MIIIMINIHYEQAKLNLQSKFSNLIPRLILIINIILNFFQAQINFIIKLSFILKIILYILIDCDKVFL